MLNDALTCEQKTKSLRANKQVTFSSFVEAWDIARNFNKHALKLNFKSWKNVENTREILAHLSAAESIVPQKSPSSGNASKASVVQGTMSLSKNALEISVEAPDRPFRIFPLVLTKAIPKAQMYCAVWDMGKVSRKPTTPTLAVEKSRKAEANDFVICQNMTQLRHVYEKIKNGDQIANKLPVPDFSVGAKAHSTVRPRFVNSYPCLVLKQNSANRLISMSKANLEVDNLLQELDGDLYVTAKDMSCTDKVRLVLEFLLDRVIVSDGLLTPEQTKSKIHYYGPHLDNQSAYIVARQTLMILDDHVLPHMRTAGSPFALSFQSAEAMFCSVLGVFYRDIDLYRVRGKAMASISPTASALFIKLNVIHLMLKPSLDPGDIHDCVMLCETVSVPLRDGYRHINQFGLQADPDIVLGVKKYQETLDTFVPLAAACGGFDAVLKDRAISSPLSKLNEARGQEELLKYLPHLSSASHVERREHLFEMVKNYCENVYFPVLSESIHLNRTEPSELCQMLWGIKAGSQGEQLVRNISRENLTLSLLRFDNKSADHGESLTLETVLSSDPAGLKFLKSLDEADKNHQQTSAILQYSKDVFAELVSLLERRNSAQRQNMAE